MTKLHELLAAEKTVAQSWNTLRAETLVKLGKTQFFEGETVTLQMLEENEANKAIEAAARVDKQLPTNVTATFDYALDLYAKAEDLQFQKNKTNAKATADFTFKGKTFTGIPIDELLGLETRLAHIRELIMAMPTLDAGKKWTYDRNQGCWISAEEYTTKTEKKLYGVILAAATEKHPAQVKEATEDKTVGKFTRVKKSGAVTAVQKANAILVIDQLTTEIKMARQRANNIEVVKENIGADLVALIMAPLKEISE